MKVIYETKGRAQEYCPLAASIYFGCEHGCSYCFAPKVLKKTRNDFLQPRYRAGALDVLMREAPQYAGKEVLMSFTTDPYQSIDKALLFTRGALGIFAQYGIRPVILTKGGLRSMRDFDILESCGGKYGATLTFLDPTLSQLEEPGAASPQDRIEALYQAKKKGIETWVSLEPVIDPQEALEIIYLTHHFVDEYKVGRLNYDPRAKSVDWQKFGGNVIETLEHFGKRYYIKRDLAAYYKRG
ncbi:MAG: radical SAM protein [Nitrospirae bacterium]|nr:radical SAM protein [Nitrospirota bacterium]